MAKKKSSSKTSSANVVSEGKIWAFIAMFFGILGFLIVLLAKRDNSYAMYYAKQSLVLFIFSVIVSFIPIVGWIISLVFWVLGWVYALSGKEKPLPLIGQFADKINL